jgi:hypothetical protein
LIGPQRPFASRRWRCPKVAVLQVGAMRSSQVHILKINHSHVCHKYKKVSPPLSMIPHRRNITIDVLLECLSFFSRCNARALLLVIIKIRFLVRPSIFALTFRQNYRSCHLLCKKRFAPFIRRYWLRHVVFSTPDLASYALGLSLCSSCLACSTDTF